MGRVHPKTVSSEAERVGHRPDATNDCADMERPDKEQTGRSGVHSDAAPRTAHLGESVWVIGYHNTIIEHGYEIAGIFSNRSIAKVAGDMVKEHFAGVFVAPAELDTFIPAIADEYWGGLEWL